MSDFSVTWVSNLPKFSIKHGPGGYSTNRGYHESYYIIESDLELDDDDFKRLDQCGLLGIGQAFSVLEKEVFEDVAQPVSIERTTGKIRPDVPPVGFGGKPYTNTHTYKFYRYRVRRICDSGD